MMKVKLEHHHHQSSTNIAIKLEMQNSIFYPTFNFQLARAGFPPAAEDFNFIWKYQLYLSSAFCTFW